MEKLQPQFHLYSFLVKPDNYPDTVGSFDFQRRNQCLLRPLNQPAAAFRLRINLLELEIMT